MAPSCSETQPDLFTTLDGNNPAGVFYLPNGNASQADQVSAIERTITHLATLQEIFEKYKANVASAPKYSGLVSFVREYRSLLWEQKDKLLGLNASTQQSTPDSTPGEINEMPPAPVVPLNSDAR